MFSFDKSEFARAAMKKWWLPGVLCLIAVAAGLLLPPMMPAQPAEAKPAPEAKAAQPPQPDRAAYTPPPLPEAPDAGAMLGRLAVGTAVVLALCVVTLWVGKRWLGG